MDDWVLTSHAQHFRAGVAQKGQLQQPTTWSARQLVPGLAWAVVTEWHTVDACLRVCCSCFVASSRGGIMCCWASC